MVQYFPEVTGSLTINGSLSVSGPMSITGSIAGTSSLASNALLLDGTGSVGFTTTGSFTATSSSLSSRTTQIESVYATTGSNSFRATQSITGSLTVTGQIIAQTLNVQQVTSSIVFSSGSNTFGCDLNSRQTFTGSVLMTGSLIVNTTGPELQVNNNGVILGNVLTDNHSITGSLRVTGSTTVFAGSIGINGSPGNSFPIESYINSSTTYTSTSRGNVLRVYNSNATANVYAGIELGGAGPSNDGLVGINGIVTAAGSGDLSFYTRNSNTFGEKMRITSGGNVGILTNCPTLALSVIGQVRAGYATDAGVTIGLTPVGVPNNNLSAYILWGDNATFGGENGDLICIPRTSTTGAHRFYTGAFGLATEKMRIASGGNVGIGTTSPYGLLDRARGVQGIQLPTSGLAALHFASAKNGGSVAQCGAILSVNGNSLGYTTFSIHLFGNATLLNGSGQSSVLSTYDIISFVKDNIGSQFCISRISSVLNNKGAGDPLLTLNGSVSSNVFTLCAAVPASGQSSYNVTGYMLTGQQGGNAGSQILTVYDGSTTSIYGA